MSIDWDAELLGPVMSVFGEGAPGVPSSWPTYTPRRGSAFQLPDAVFDEQYHRVVEQGDGSEVSTSTPVLGVRASLFEQPPAQGDRVLIPSNGKTYRVADAQADGHGHVLLVLIEAAA